MKAAVALVLSTSVLFSPQSTQDSPAQTGARAALAAATDPADCVKALRTFLSRRQQEVRPPAGFTAELLKQVEDEKVALGKSCIARFETTTNPAVLPGLAELYMEVALPDKGRDTIASALKANASPIARAATLVAAVSLGLREPKSDERNARLEALIQELDANTAATLDQKWTAHNRLENYYRGDDIDAGILKHARWMADTAKSFTPEQHTKYGSSVVQAQV